MQKLHFVYEFLHYNYVLARHWKHAFVMLSWKHTTKDCSPRRFAAEKCKHKWCLCPWSSCVLFWQTRSSTNLFVSLQLKGQDDLKALVESNTKSISDQLTVLNSYSNKLDEISSTLSILPKQIETDLKQQSDTFRIFRKDTEVALEFLMQFLPKQPEKYVHSPGSFQSGWTAAKTE